jgi:putative transposase
MDIGEVYFYTSTIVSWKKLLMTDNLKTIIIDSLKNLVDRGLIIVYGFVIMPNHIHIIWELKSMNGKELPDTSFTKFTAHQFKRELQLNHPKILNLACFISDKKDRAYQFWQRDPLAIRIFSREMMLQKLAYIHLNPLHERWNLADRPENYPWSSAHFYEFGIDQFGFLTHFMDRF